MRAHIALRWLLKAAGAGSLALLCLSVACVFYYNPAIRRACDTGATDYLWESGSFYSGATEGVAMGVIDENGYNNLPRTAGLPIDVLIMGSSHIEGFNVAQRDTAVYVLNSISGLSCYSIGTSGHTLPRNASNLADALAAYEPRRAVVIETSTVLLDAQETARAAAGTLEPIATFDSGLLYILQKNPFFRLMYAQMKSALPAASFAQGEPERANAGPLLRLAAQSAKEAGCPLAIVYHPTLLLREDGTAYVAQGREDIEAFSALCAENGIHFIDLSEAFLQEYTQSSALPHGFSNTASGSGHLNRYGHRMIAENIAEWVGADK